MGKVVVFLAVGFWALAAGSQGVAVQPLADWIFVPEYSLGGRAANHPGPRIPHPHGHHPLVEL